MTDRYRPADAEADEFRRRLCEVILWALEKVVEQARPAVAVALADEIDAGRRRLMTRVEISGDDGQPDIETLRYRVEVEALNGWIELVEAGWRIRGVSPEGAREAARMTALQHGFGIPDDPSELDSSPLKREAYRGRARHLRPAASGAEPYHLIGRRVTGRRSRRRAPQPTGPGATDSPVKVGGSTAPLPPERHFQREPK